MTELTAKLVGSIQLSSMGGLCIMDPCYIRRPPQSFEFWMRGIKDNIWDTCWELNVAAVYVIQDEQGGVAAIVVADSTASRLKVKSLTLMGEISVDSGSIAVTTPDFMFDLDQAGLNTLLENTIEERLFGTYFGAVVISTNRDGAFTLFGVDDAFIIPVGMFKPFSFKGVTSIRLEKNT